MTKPTRKTCWPLTPSLSTTAAASLVAVASAAVSAKYVVGPIAASPVRREGHAVAQRDELPPLTRGAHEALLLAARQTAFAELGEEVSAARQHPNNSRATIVRGERGVSLPLATLHAERRGL